jgi:hypothetical protein
MSDLKKILGDIKSIIAGTYNAAFEDAMPTVAPTAEPLPEATPIEPAAMTYDYNVTIADDSKVVVTKKEQVEVEEGDIVKDEAGVVMVNATIVLKDGSVLRTDATGIVMPTLTELPETIAITPVDYSPMVTALSEKVAIQDAAISKMILMLEKICAQPTAMAATVEPESFQDKLKNKKEQEFLAFADSIKKLKQQ